MNPILKEADFRRELKGSVRAGYLFFGDEDYLKSFALKQAREQISPDPGFAVFNEMHLEAVDFTPDRLLDALMPLPMMADRKLVTVSGLNFLSMRPNDLDALCDVLAALPEYDYNVLILTVAADCFDPGYLPKKPSALLERLSEFRTPVQFERCTGARLAAWIQKHFAHRGVEASPAFCTAMPEYCGHSMFVLANEIDKLCYYVLSHGRNTVTDAEMRLVCTPAEEYDAFAFTNAIMEGRQDTALAILADLRFRRVEPIVILSDVTRVICEMISVRTMTAEGTPPAEIGAAISKPPMHEYRVKLYQKSLRTASERRLARALDACLVADAAVKGSFSNDYTAIERLICSL